MKEKKRNSFRMCILKLLPLQGARPFVSVTQGVASLAPMLGAYWAFSPRFHSECHPHELNSYRVNAGS